MFERELAAWIETCVARERLSSLQLEELSDHLLHKAELLVAQGRDRSAAFSSAARDLGEVSLLAAEFQKVSHAMNPISKCIGIAITSTLFFAGADSVISLGIFLHLPALAIVLGVVVGGLWASFGPQTMWRTLRFSLAGAGSAQADERELFEAVLRRGHSLSWAAGVLGMLVGIIGLLQNLSFEDPSAFGSALALCILTLLYGALMAELGFRTLRQWLRASAPTRVLA